MTFIELLSKHRGYIPHIRVLALDPGQTTGVAILEEGRLIEWSQLGTKDIPIGIKELSKLYDRIQPQYIISEAYKIYGWKKDSHAWSELHTSQLIGVIKTLAQQRNIPHEERLAQEAKVFCTDTKLEEWGMYKPGMKHARDAIRHGCFSYLFSKHHLFNKPKES